MRRSRFGAAIALGAVVCLAIANDAAACHNAITISTDAVARQLRNADELVRTGRSVDALGVVDSALHLLRHGHSRGGGTELDADLRSRRVRLLRERGERIIAIIVVRRDGAVDRARMRAPSRVSAAQRTENLAWALERLTPAAGEDGTDAILDRVRPPAVMLDIETAKAKVPPPFADVAELAYAPD